MREPTEKSHGETSSIFLQIEHGLSQRLYDDVVQRELVKLNSAKLVGELPITELDVKTNSKLLNIVVVESCDTKQESCVRSEDGVSNFLRRFNDAFRGGAVNSPECCKLAPLDGSRRAFTAQEIITYVNQSVRDDAARMNDKVKAQYMKHAHTKFELAAEFEEISQTPQLIGTAPVMNFALGVIPGTAKTFLPRH